MGKQYKIDSQIAQNHVYSNKGKGPNPYQYGTRIHRLWEKYRIDYLNIESRMDDLCKVYGECRPNKLAEMEENA